MINRILTLMKKNKINAKTLTTNAGLSISAISDWKSGKSKPSTDAVIKIAEFFAVSTDYLLLGKDTEGSLTATELELLNLFRRLESEKIQERFIGKAEMIIQDMLEQDMKKSTGS